MPFEAFKARIESVREPEAIQAWLAKMKKATRFTWKTPAPAAKATASATPAPEAISVTEATHATSEAEATPATEATPAVEPAPAVEAATIPVVAFDSFEEAKAHLLATAREKVVRVVEQARLHGKNLELLPPGEIRSTVEGSLERQRRFPLDTANALRGRLRREHFTIFKKGSKGVSYVCAVKRKFRVPGQTFSDSIGALIAFIEANPMVKAGELGKKFLNIAPPPAAPAAEGVPPVATGETVLSIDQREKFARVQSDLPWLVREGYVTEFIDGALYAPPAMVEARKREVEAAEHDPENFPEAPAAAPKPRATATAPEAKAVPEAASMAAPEAEAVAPIKAEKTEAPVQVVAEAVVESAPAAEEPKTEPPAAPSA